jgi:hypothetical protein
MFLNWYALSLCKWFALLGDALVNIVRNGSISSDGIDDGCSEIDGAIEGVEVGDDEGLAEGFYVK